MKKRPLSRPADTPSPPGGERDRARGVFDANALFAFLFGLFLGLAIWKFGNPVILDHKIFPPASLAEWWADAWPTHWGNWILLPLVLAGGWLALSGKPRWLGTRWLWLLPLVWFGWQLVSATHTVDAFLTRTTLWQFGGCFACYFIGAMVIGSPASGPARWSSSFSLSENTLKRELQPDFPPRPEAGAPHSWNAFNFLLVGILAAFTFCLVRAVDQRLFEFPAQPPVAGGRRTHGLDQFPTGNAARNETRWHHHQYQRPRRGQSGHARPGRQRPRDGHAGLSERAGRFDSLVAAGVTGARFQQHPPTETAHPWRGDCRDLPVGRAGPFLVRLKSGLAAGHGCSPPSGCSV